MTSRQSVAVRPGLCTQAAEMARSDAFRTRNRGPKRQFSGCCHTPLQRLAAMGLSITFVVIVVFAVGITVGALGPRLWARSRRSDHEPSDGGLAGLAQHTAALDGRVASVHGMLVDLLRVQTTAGERLAVVSEQAADLHLTLSSNQRRGAWGELLCEDILRCAGMQDGLHYQTQRTLPTGSRPDFTVSVADGRLLHIDAKFPLSGYRKLEQAETDEAREAARKEFIADIKRHTKALVDRGYGDPATTVGFCILFIANPSTFTCALEADPDIIKHALERHVVLADAGTLTAILMLTKSASDAFRVQRRTMDVLRIVTEFRGEWEAFSAHLDKTDKQITTVLRSWEALTGTRRRQLQRRLDRIDGLEVGDEPAPIAPDTPAAAPPDSGPSDRADIVQSCANGSAAASQRPHRAPAAAAT